MAKQPSKPPFRVGVVGESVFDTKAMQDLLQKQYGQRAQFVPMVVRLDGGQLDGKKARTMFSLTYEAKRPDLVVVFRDLDGPEDDKVQRRKRRKFFEELNNLMEQKGILLLHVYTIEALLIAHVEVFQKKYGWQCRVPVNPTTIANPTQFLRDASRHSKRPYEKTLCPDLMAQVDYAFLLKRCRYFAKFDQEFSQHLA